MMTEILKPLLENDVLTDEVKEAIEKSLTEAIAAKEDAVRTEVEEQAKANFEAATVKFEESYKTLEETFNTKLEEAKSEATVSEATIGSLETTVADLQAKPFINITESDMEEAEATLTTELTESLEAKYEAAFDVAKDKFNNAFELINDQHIETITDLSESLETVKAEKAELETSITTMTESLTESKAVIADFDIQAQIDEAVKTNTEAMTTEADARVAELKENLVTSTEIFLEQELAEMKADYTEMMKEKQGRDLLESIKGLVKQHWDVDSEVAEEILEMKKEAEAKVVQYKDMLKKEHSRLEESQKEIEDLKKKVIVESKGSVLTTDKKEALEKLAENIGSEKLETEIDKLMESVVDTFNSGFTKKEVESKLDESKTEETKVEKVEEVITESTQTTISSGNTADKMSDDLASLMDLAGIK